MNYIFIAASNYIATAQVEKIYILGIAVAAIAFFLFDAIIEAAVHFVPYYAVYVDNSRYVIGEIKMASVLQVGIRFGLFLLGLYFIKKKGRMGQEEAREIRSLHMVYIAAVITLLSLKFSLIERCAYYFWQYAIVVIPNAINNIKSIRNRNVIWTAVVLFCLSYFWVVNLIRPDWNRIYPYQTIFTNPY